MEEKLEKRVETYLEVESVLNDFFKELDFCYENCLTQEESLFLSDLPGHIGCCSYNQHDQAVFPFKEILDTKRDEKYPKPEINYEACDYHTMDGCLLGDHKPPACITYVCPKFRTYLSNRFDIIYDNDHLNELFKGILSGKTEQKEISRFKSEFNYYIEKIKFAQTGF
ncbi:hypothetical protein GF361_03725 [Candidatus Woesearchaeota archaeon]|nr:hypothetical protein [Candidatus Woesearchaeota archaeon]